MGSRKGLAFTKFQVLLFLFFKESINLRLSGLQKPQNIEISEQEYWKKTLDRYEAGPFCAPNSSFTSL